MIVVSRESIHVQKSINIKLGYICLKTMPITNEDRPGISTLELLDLIIQMRQLEIQILRAQLTLGSVVDTLDQWLPASPPDTPSSPINPFYPIIISKRTIAKSLSKCAICYDKPSTTKLLPCKHDQFCKTCIARNATFSHRCPLCRADIHKALVRRIDSTFVPTKEKPFLFGPWIP